MVVLFHIDFHQLYENRNLYLNIELRRNRDDADIVHQNDDWHRKLQPETDCFFQHRNGTSQVYIPEY